MQETWVRSLGWEDPLEKGKATPSSVLAWRIPRTVYSMGSWRVGHDGATFTCPSLRRLCKTTSHGGEQAQRLLPGPCLFLSSDPFHPEPIRGQVIQDSFLGTAPLVPSPGFHHPCLDCQHLPSDHDLQAPQLYLFPKCELSRLGCAQPSLCDPIDCSPPGSSVHGILQARILQWVAISFSRVSSPPRGQTQVFRIAGRFFTI